MGWHGGPARRWLQVFARLKPGITPQQAQASLEPLYKQFLRCRDRDAAGRQAASSRGIPQREKAGGRRGRQGNLQPAAIGREAAVGTDGDGGPGAADRLRECGEPADGARGRPAEGDRDSDFARRVAMADRTATAVGKRRSVVRRRMPGSARRRLDRRSAASAFCRSKKRHARSPQRPMLACSCSISRFPLLRRCCSDLFPRFRLPARLSPIR